MPIVDELSSVPVGALVGALGRGIAEAQRELDLASLRIAQTLAGLDDRDRVTVAGRRRSLLELGLTPTFYRFTETMLELKIAVSITSASAAVVASTHAEAERAALGWSGRERITASAAAVGAAYSCKYQYAAEGSSMVRTRLVPVPAPALLDKRIRAMLDEEQRFAAGVQP